MPDNSAQNMVQRLARRLLAEADSHPALIHRSSVERLAKPFPAMALLSDPALDIRQYLENLVTIAVGSAHHAEDMLLEVRKVNRTARRRIAVVASFGAIGLMVGIAGFTVSRSSNVTLSEVRAELGELRSLGQDIASLRQHREQAQAGVARQEALREALQQQIADLQRQARFLQDQVARGSRDLENVNADTSKLRHNLQASPASVQDQVALRSHDLRAAGSEDDNPRAQVEATRTGIEKSRPPPGALQRDKGEQAAPIRQKAHVPQMAVPALQPPSASSLIPAAAVMRPIPVLMPEPSVSQQLLIARQWLAAGHVDQARHILAMVQTRMVLQPFESNRAAARGVNAAAMDVGDAIRSLDLGFNEQAMQALNKAMFIASSN